MLTVYKITTILKKNVTSHLDDFNFSSASTKEAAQKEKLIITAIILEWRRNRGAEYFNMAGAFWFHPLMSLVGCQNGFY